MQVVIVRMSMKKPSGELLPSRSQLPRRVVLIRSLRDSQTIRSVF